MIKIFFIALIASALFVILYSSHSHAGTPSAIEENSVKAERLAEELQNSADNKAVWPKLENKYWDFLKNTSEEKEPRELIIHWIGMAEEIETYTARCDELLKLSEENPGDQNIQWFLATTARFGQNEDVEYAARQKIIAPDPQNLKRLAQLSAKKGDLASSAKYLNRARNSNDVQSLLLLPKQALVLQADGKLAEAIELLDSFMAKVHSGKASENEKGIVYEIAYAYVNLNEKQKAADAYILASEFSTLKFRKQRLLLEGLKLKKQLSNLTESDWNLIKNLSKNADVDNVRAEAAELLK